MSDLCQKKGNWVTKATQVGLDKLSLKRRDPSVPLSDFPDQLLLLPCHAASCSKQRQQSYAAL